MQSVFDQVVGTGAGVAGLAVHHGVGKTGDMTGGLPDLGTTDDGGVETDHVLTVTDKRFPPQIFDFTFELRPQWAIVPSVGEPAINVGTGEEEAAALGQGHNISK